MPLGKVKGPEPPRCLSTTLMTVPGSHCDATVSHTPNVEYKLSDLLLRILFHMVIDVCDLFSNPRL